MPALRLIADPLDTQPPFATQLKELLRLTLTRQGNYRT
jgi:hypothetical protein